MTKKKSVYLFNSPNLKLLEKDWLTPNTYGENYSVIPEQSGIYLIVYFDMENLIHTIMYIGSSKNLAKRYKTHETLRLLKIFYNYIHFYFKVMDNYISEEKRLIQIIKPKFNKQHIHG